MAPGSVRPLIVIAYFPLAISFSVLANWSDNALEPKYPFWYSSLIWLMAVLATVSLARVAWLALSLV